MTYLYSVAINLVIEVREAIAARTSNSRRASAVRLGVQGRRWRSSGYFSPAGLEEGAHAVAGLAHRTVVLVEDLAVRQHLSDVGAEVVSRFISARNSENMINFWSNLYDNNVKTVFR